MHPRTGHAYASLAAFTNVVSAGVLTVVRFAVARCLVIVSKLEPMQSGRQQICFYKYTPFVGLEQG
jgi:hypothetical protein